MSECKFQNIVDEIKKRISSNVYQRRLPGVRALSAEFQTSTSTIGKALAILKLCGFVTTSPGGVYVARGKKVDFSRNIAVIQKSTAEPQGDDVSKHLKDLIESNGDKFLLLAPPETDSREFRELGMNPPLAGVIFIGTYDPALARQLRKRHIPMVSANRLPENEGVAWADWNHTAEFTAAVEFLVAEGYRRIAFFQYLYPNLMEHWLLIQRDFDHVAREFQLRNPDLEVFVKENGWDCATFADFWQHQPQLPEVVVRIGSEADDLVEELQKRNIVNRRDLKILLVKFAAEANKVWAHAVWELLQRSRRNPLATVRQKILKPLRVFEWL